MPLPSCTVTARIFFSLAYPRMSMVFTESLPLLFSHLSTANFIWMSEMLTFVSCTSPLCPPLHISDKLGCVAGRMIRVTLLLLNASTWLSTGLFWKRTSFFLSLSGLGGDQVGESPLKCSRLCCAVCSNSVLKDISSFHPPPNSTAIKHLLTHEAEYLDPPSCLLANYCHYLARQTCHEIRISSQNRVISGSSCYPVLCKSVTSAAKRQLRFLRIHTLPGGEQKSIST